MSHTVNNIKLWEDKDRRASVTEKKQQLLFSVTKSIKKFLKLFHTVGLMGENSPIVNNYSSNCTQVAWQVLTLECAAQPWGLIRDEWWWVDPLHLYLT